MFGDVTSQMMRCVFRVLSPKNASRIIRDVTSQRITLDLTSQINLELIFFAGAYESNNFAGSNDNLASTIGTAISGFQNQGVSTFNSFAGQANGFLTNIGTAVGNQLCAGGSSCSAGSRPTSSAQTQTVNDEQEESAGPSENVISANLVEQQAPEQAAPQPQQQLQQPEPQQQPQQPQQQLQQPERQQQQPQQQQNDVHEEYLPPKH